MAAFEPYDRQHFFWRNHSASLVADVRGVTINYHECDAVGRFGKVISSECAPFHHIAVHLGGTRRLVLCPGCGRRCGILYCGSDRLRCRVCAGLLDINQFPEKPKRMRWSTYERLSRRHDVHAERLAALAVRHLARFL